MPFLASVLLIAGVGAITGEKTVAESLASHAETCHAGAPSVGMVSGGRLPVSLDVPGLTSLRCFTAELATDSTRARSTVERLSCDAPDRSVDLRCELTLQLREGSGWAADDTVNGIVSAAIAAELDVEKLAILSDRIELAGDLPSEKARTDLEAAAAKPGTPVRSFGLSVRAPLAPDAMPLLTKGTGPAQLHLAGIPATAALSLIGDPARPFVALAGGDPITGRLSAVNRAGLARALASVQPVTSAPVAFTGKGRKVDLSFQSVDAAALASLLGDVMKLNTVVPGSTKPVTVFAKTVPADSVVASLAKVLGLTQVRQGSTLFLVPAGMSLRASSAKEAMRSLSIDGATAAEALSLVVAEAPIPFCLPAGKPVRLTLRNATATTTAEALRIVDGAEPIDAATCTRAPALEVKTSRDFAPLRLIATLTGTAPARALVRKEDGSVAILESPSGLTITSTGVRLKTPGERAELTLGTSGKTFTPASLLDHRLVATLVSAQGSAAVLQGRGGRIRVVQPGWTEEGSVEVLPGSLRISVDSRDMYGSRKTTSTEMFLRPPPR